MLAAFTLSAAALLPGAPLPENLRKATRAPWLFSEEGATLDYSLARHESPFRAQPVLRPTTHTWVDLPVRRVRFGSESETLFTLVAHPYTPFLVEGTVLYYADFSHHGCGCALVAFDLGRKKRLWRARLKGIGPVERPGYHNRVNLDLDGTALRVYGNETAGRYVEFVDIKSGKTVGHKVFPKKK